MRLINVLFDGQNAAPWGLDVALLSEAHGLVTDLLLAEGTMPPQLASGLRALANLLSPPQPQSSGVGVGVAFGPGGAPDKRPRHTLPHVALSDVQYSSDTEEIPYTGETLLHLSKVSVAVLERPSRFYWINQTRYARTGIFVFCC